LYNKRSFLTGIQARVKIKDLNSRKIIFYPYIGEYAWLAPEGEEYARIGIAAKSNAKLLFDNFIKKFPGKIEEIQGGPIPLHRPGIKVQQIVKKNRVSEQGFVVSLLGDAALQIKNTTGGGIIPGLNAAKALSKGFNTYNTELKPLNRELLVHYYMNKALNNYSDKDWDRLINKVNNPKIKMILLKTNRDEAKKMLFKLLTKPNMLIEGLRAGIKTL